MLSFGILIVLLAVALLVAPYRMARKTPPPKPTSEEDSAPHE